MLDPNARRRGMRHVVWALGSGALLEVAIGVISTLIGPDPGTIVAWIYAALFLTAALVVARRFRRS